VRHRVSPRHEPAGWNLLSLEIARLKADRVLGAARRSNGGGIAAAAKFEK
jgi:hypothetical protein